MNFFEAQEFYKSIYPNKLKTFEFDEKCYRSCECIMTDGLPNPVHHIECDKVKVTIEGESPHYLPIKPHRMNCSWVEMKNMFMKKDDVWMHPSDLKALSEMRKSSPKDYEMAIKERESITGLRKDQIESKMSQFDS